MVKAERGDDMPFVKKTSKIDIHLWLEEKHVEVIDDLARRYGMSRAAVIAQFIEDYATNHKDPEDDEPVSRNPD